MDTLETLKAIKALIEDSNRWTQKIGARNRKGMHVNAADPKAVCWCVAGAHLRVTGEYRMSESAAWQAIESASSRLFNFHAINVNDIIGHAAVMQVLDAAIADAEQAQP